MSSASLAPFALPIIAKSFALLLSAPGPVALAWRSGSSALAGLGLLLRGFRFARLATFLALGGPFFWLAPFFEEVLSGATGAPGSATLAASFVVLFVATK